MTEIKCANCKSVNIDYVDEMEYGKELYYCEDCDEYFYVHTTLINGELKFQVSMDKWKNFKTI